jgi:TatD DNase family protein
MLIDTHCHLQFNAYKNDADLVANKCEQQGMILNVVGSQRDTSERAVKLAEQYPFIYATVGLHPIHSISTEVDEEEIQFKSREEIFDYEFYINLALHPKTIAIGECGLELFHLPKEMNEELALKKQKEIFLAQYKLAEELDLPLVIHVRNAHSQMLDTINTLPNLKGVIHCYTENWDIAKKYLDLDLYIGFTGVITFPAKKTCPEIQNNLIEAVKKTPMDKILIETDAPYLAPQAYRGERCEPWMVQEVALKIAEIKQISVNDVIEQTAKNAMSLFKKIQV